MTSGLSNLSQTSFRIYNRWMQRNSNFLFRGILRTPPVSTDPAAETVLFSALNRQNCRAYIAAAKSFLRFYPQVSVEVQDDGDLDETCRQELRSHLVGITIHTRESMHEIIRENLKERVRAAMPPPAEYFSAKPVKILYLKFFNVISRYPGRKVIFLDSDMLFLNFPRFIIDWIENPYQGDFHSGGKNTMAARLQKIFNLPDFDLGNFNSGILGVGGGFDQDEVAEILEQIRAHDRGLFHEWEIEQSVWAVFLARRGNSTNLSGIAPRYIGNAWMSRQDLQKRSTVAHFVGAARFKNLTYLRLAHEIIGNLENP